jgi:hypothetical protein
MDREPYGKHSVVQSEYCLDPELLKASRTEYVLSSINEVLSSVQVNLRHLHELVVDADDIYDDDLAILIAQRKKRRLITSALM